MFKFVLLPVAIQAIVTICLETVIIGTVTIARLRSQCSASMQTAADTNRMFVIKLNKSTNFALGLVTLLIVAL
jgi:hypothetical protein